MVAHQEMMSLDRVELPEIPKSAQLCVVIGVITDTPITLLIQFVLVVVVPLCVEFHGLQLNTGLVE